MKTAVTLSKEQWDALEYPIAIRKLSAEEGGGWYAWIPLLGEGMFSMPGETPEEALQLLEEHRRDSYEVLVESGTLIKLPDSDEHKASGRWLMRVSPRLHTELQQAAEKEGISFNAYCTACLERGHTLHNVEETVQKAVADAISKMHQQIENNLRRSVCTEIRSEIARFKYPAGEAEPTVQWQVSSHKTAANNNQRQKTTSPVSAESPRLLAA